MDNRPKAEGLLKEKERLDTLQRNGYVIIQNPEKFCFGMDAVLLSGFAKAGKGKQGAGSWDRNGNYPHPDGG